MKAQNDIKNIRKVKNFYERQRQDSLMEKMLLDMKSMKKTAMGSSDSEDSETSSSSSEEEEDIESEDSIKSEKESNRLLTIIENQLEKRNLLTKDFNFELNNCKYAVYLDKHCKKGLFQDKQKKINVEKIKLITADMMKKLQYQ
jgi:hypothetical protein